MLFRRRFPKEVQTAHLGRFVFHEEKHSGIVSRRYEADGLCTLAQRQVEVIAWPPKRGMEAHQLTAALDDFWIALSTNLEAILLASHPVVESKVLARCDPGDEHPLPTAAHLLSSSVLQMVGIDLQSSTPQHEIFFRDDSDLIGGHDLVLILDANLRPISAYLDG